MTYKKEPMHLHNYSKCKMRVRFEDALLKIRAVKPKGRAQMEITNASIEQILDGGAIKKPLRFMIFILFLIRIK